MSVFSVDKKSQKLSGLKGIRQMLEGMCCLRLPVEIDSYRPSTCSFIPTNILISRLVIQLDSSIAKILGASRNAKIWFAVDKKTIVQSVMKTMIRLTGVTFFKVKDSSVHEFSSVAAPGHRVKTAGFSIVFGVPAYLAQFFVKLNINERYLPFIKNDFTIGWLKGWHRNLISGVRSIAGALTPTPQVYHVLTSQKVQ